MVLRNPGSETHPKDFQDPHIHILRIILWTESESVFACHRPPSLCHHDATFLIYESIALVYVPDMLLPLWYWFDERAASCYLFEWTRHKYVVYLPSPSLLSFNLFRSLSLFAVELDRSQQEKSGWNIRMGNWRLLTITKIAPSLYNHYHLSFDFLVCLSEKMRSLP